MVRVPDRIEIVAHQIFDEPVRLVVALALFVLHDAALVIQLLLRHRAEQMPHAVALQEQCALQSAGRHRLEIVCPVEPCRPVEIRRSHLLQRLEIIARRILRPVEHQMFEEMCEPGLALRLMLRADAVPDRNGHNGRLAIRVHDDAQAVRQRELLVRNVDEFRQVRRGRRRRNNHGRRRNQQRQ